MSTDRGPGLTSPSPDGSIALRIERVAITHPDALRLIDEVQAEYVARYGGPDESPIDPADFEDPTGQFFVAYLDAEPIATGAWRRSTVTAFGIGESAEVKRMYVVPRSQRRGVARAMLAHIESTAATAGIGVLVLETGMRQPEAIELYTSSGYQEIPGFGYYCGSDLSRCFGKPL